MMKQISLLIFVFLFNHALSAQNNKPCGCDDQVGFETKLVGSTFVLPQGVNVKTFISKLPIQSDIYLMQNEVVTNIEIQYNGYIDEIIWQKPVNHTLIQLDKDLIAGFKFYNFDNDTNVLFEKIKINKEAKTDSVDVFAQRLLKDRVSLFCYYTSYIVDVQTISYKAQVFNKNIFKPTTIYFFKLNNNKTIGFKNFRKKHLYALFPEKKVEMSKKFKEFKQHRFRTEDDLVQIAKILSQIF